MLREALRAEDLGADRRLHRAARAVEDGAQRLRRIGQQAQQLGLGHRLQQQRQQQDRQAQQGQGGDEARALTKPFIDSAAQRSRAQRPDRAEQC